MAAIRNGFLWKWTGQDGKIKYVFAHADAGIPSGELNTISGEFVTSEHKHAEHKRHNLSVRSTLTRSSLVTD